MSLTEILELRKKRKGLYDEAVKVRELATAEKRAVTGEEEQKFTRIMDEVDALAKTIDAEERVLAAAGAVKDLPEGVKTVGEDEGKKKADEYRAAFSAYLKFGREGLDPEQRKILMSGARQLDPEARALSATSGSAGGYTVPYDYYAGVVDAMKFFGGMRTAKTNVFTTESGEEMKVPAGNDTGNTGAIVAENVQIASNVDMTFSQPALPTFMFTSKIILVPIQLLQDGAFDVDAYLRKKVAERIGRAQNTYFTVGAGPASTTAPGPSGVVTGATKYADTAALGAITADEILSLVHSVDPAYRFNGEFMMNDSTLLTVRKLKDTYGQYLWQPSVQMGVPDRLFGYSVIVNNDMAAIGASAKTVLFGDFSNYWIRDVKGMTILRLDERYADYLQVGFMAFVRAGGVLVDAGVHPLKYLQQKATT